MAPAAFFRVPCTHRIMYTVQCVYRALSERDSGRTDGRVRGGAIETIESEREESEERNGRGGGGG